MAEGHLNPGDFRRIKGLSDRRRLPRLGRIRLGERRVSKKTGEEYPAALPHFRVCPDDQDAYPDIDGILGGEPTRLTIMLPADEQESVFPQAYAWYGLTRLKCRGNGERAVRRVCSACGVDAALDVEGKLRCGHPDRHSDGSDATEWRDRACPCEHLEDGSCVPRGSLMVILPEIDMAGVWQMDTSSEMVIEDINSAIDLCLRLHGRVSMVPGSLLRTEWKNSRGQTVYGVKLLYHGSYDECRARLAAAGPPAKALAAPVLEGDEEAAVEVEEERTERTDKTEKTDQKRTDQASLPPDVRVLRQEVAALLRQKGYDPAEKHVVASVIGAITGKAKIRSDNVPDLRLAIEALEQLPDKPPAEKSADDDIHQWLDPDQAPHEDGPPGAGESGQNDSPALPPDEGGTFFGDLEAKARRGHEGGDSCT